MNTTDQVRRWLGPAIFVAASFVAADLTAAKVEQSLSAPPAVSATNVVKPPIPANVTAVLNGLGNPGELQFVLSNTAGHAPPNVTVNGTNTTVNGTVVNGTNTTIPQVPQGALPKLTGTLAGGGHSLAVLQSGDETRVCAVGESMNGYTVTEVTQFSVSLRDLQGAIHRLSLELAQASNNTTIPAPGTTLPAQPPPGNLTPQPPAVPPGGLVTRGQMQDYMNNYQQWINHMNVKPIKRGEEVVGMQINYNAADNPLAKLGVNSGDILTNLNGHPLKSPEDLQWAYGELRNATTLNFQLERNNQMVPLNLHLND